MSVNCTFVFDALPGIQNDAVLSLIYAPLMGQKALKTYEILEAAALNHTGMDLDALLDLCQFNEAVLTGVRKTLEQYRLLVTYRSKESGDLFFHLQPAMDPKAFLSHEVFGRIFFEKMGKHRVEAILKLFGISDAEEDLENISTLDLGDLDDLKWNPEKERSFRKFIPKKHRAEKYPFNWALFFQGMTRVFPEAVRTDSNLDRISYLANLYGIGELDMRTYVRRVFNKKSGVFNFDQLVSLLNGSTKTKIDRSIDQSSPILYLMSTLPENVKLSRPTREAISEVCLNYSFSDEVVIEMIKYTLFMTGGSFNEKYFSKVAQTWHRRGIDTVAKAEKELEEAKEFKKKDQGDALPDWYSVKPEETASEEEIEQALALFNS